MFLAAHSVLRKCYTLSANSEALVSANSYTASEGFSIFNWLGVLSAEATTTDLLSIVGSTCTLNLM